MLIDLPSAMLLQSLNIQVLQKIMCSELCSNPAYEKKKHTPVVEKKKNVPKSKNTKIVQPNIQLKGSDNTQKPAKVQDSSISEDFSKRSLFESTT